MPETVEHFGLGFCTKGMMKDRIAIPIHNHQGQLIAYSGRAISEELTKEEGKYKLPSSDRGFFKSYVLYNLHQQHQQKQNNLIIVESFKSVWHFHQMNIMNVVTPFGSSLSAEQMKLLVDYLGVDGKVLLMFDDDEAGKTGRENALLELSSKVFVKVVDIGDYAKKPHQLTQEQVCELLKGVRNETDIA